MSDVFSRYAGVYDLLYADKDYAAEAAFVDGLIRAHAPKAGTLLDLGCGTARHALEFAGRGYRVHGIDFSPQMVSLARERLSGAPKDIAARISVAEGDVSRYSAAERYDAVTALFHVACYQTGNRALAGLFAAARSALGGDGVFVFDFWYGPAVLSDRPTARVKEIDGAALHITRSTEPVLREDRDVVEVNFNLTVVEKNTGKSESFHEVHGMRYLFLPELELFADTAGLELVSAGQWLTGAPLTAASWLGYAVAKVKA